MNLLIGENIKRMRREGDLTQEEVAAHLGISFQAISKWERADGYPDITMLRNKFFVMGKILKYAVQHSLTYVLHIGKQANMTKH